MTMTMTARPRCPSGRPAGRVQLLLVLKQQQGQTPSPRRSRARSRSNREQLAAEAQARALPPPLRPLRARRRTVVVLTIAVWPASACSSMTGRWGSGGPVCPGTATVSPSPPWVRGLCVYV
jgi:hypothetical protein